MLLSNSTYDILKWIDLIVLPALGTAYAGLARIWNLPYSEQIPATIMVICTLLGALLGISNVQYKQTQQSSVGAFMESYEDFTNGILDDSKEDDK